MDAAHFEALQNAKKDNYLHIYKVSSVRKECDEIIRPMMHKIFLRLLEDLQSGKTDSPVFRHHIEYVTAAPYARKSPYEKEAPALIVTDYIASMTDDYFIDLYAFLFPEEEGKIRYKGYFDRYE